MTTVGVAARISRLRLLIDHPRTGEAERAAAQRMLDRVLRKSADAARRSSPADRTHGARYGRAGRHAGLQRVCEMIAADIDLVRVMTTPQRPDAVETLSAIRNAPAQVRYSVETSGQLNIVIVIEGVPREWGWVRRDGIQTVSPALQALAEELAELMNEYNYDGTDTDKRFFGSVRAADTTLVW